MASLLTYKSRRSPAQNALLSFIVLFWCCFAFGVFPTQWFAAQYQYDKNLGDALLRGSRFALYAPTDWVRWGIRLGDVAQLKTNVHIMLGIGLFSQVLALLVTVFAAIRLARSPGGMDGLHGTAHFAEHADIDKTGFINARGYKSSGVVIGSVMFDSRDRVVHPHHKKFNNRYRPVHEPRTWRSPLRQRAKRDGSNRPLFAIRKTVVHRVELMRDSGNTHLFAFCPTRSGKGVGMVLPTLLTWPNSVMVNDPKGEAYALTAGFRAAAGQDVIKFEPACTNGTGARWNPLDEIRVFTLRDVADAQMIMSMACDPKGEGLDDYFDKAGYEFLTAVALHVRYMGQDGSLAGAANFLGDPNWDSDKQMYTEMMQAKHDPEGKMAWKDSLGNPTKTHPMIANAAKTMLNKEDKDRSGVLSTAKSLLSLYLDPIVAMNTCCSDFLVRDLMTGKNPVSLYYVVTPEDMERMTPLTRLFYALFIRRNASEMVFKDGRSVPNYSFPLLMIIDEAASLRKLPILQEALGYVAGYGIRLFMLVQDITQVEELYGDKQSFDSGAETRIVYAPNKVETAEKLARMSGKTTVTEESASNSREVMGWKAGSVSLSHSKTPRDLITADEFMALDDQDIVVFVKGKPPIYGRKAFFYENPVMVARASIAAPKRSAQLRVTNTQAVVAPPDPVEELITAPREKWSASKDAMRERIYAAAMPSAPSSDSPQGAPVNANTPVHVKRSLYAEQAHVLTDEERMQVKALVANVQLVNRVVAIEAF